VSSSSSEASMDGFSGVPGGDYLPYFTSHHSN
jgi:hypothetical protein